MYYITWVTRMAFSIRMTKEEEALAKSHALLHGISFGEAFKRALFEKIEDEYDVAIGEAAYREYPKDPETISLRELMEEEDR